MQAGAGELEQSQGAGDLEAIADEDDLPAVKAVGDVAGREQEEQAGQKLGQAGVAQVERTVGDGVDLPGNGQRLRRRAQNGGHARQLEASKISGGKGLHAAPGRPGGKRHHGLPQGYIARQWRNYLSNRTEAADAMPPREKTMPRYQ